MTKTLKTIQTIMKVGKVLATIVFVCCIIGAVGCALGIVGLSLTSMLGVTLDMKMLAELLDEESLAMFADGSIGAYIGIAYFGCIVGIISCVAEAVLARLAVNYFKKELETGTPFTFEGAKEMFRLGVINLCVMLGLSVVEGMIFAILWIFFPEITEPSTSVSLGTGLWMMILSVFFKHGAEISAQRSEENAEDVKEEIKF
ncbi:MAG: hypothetical protein E7642_02825 [Ruminococcaceae bacterium]|nr:hypothetical protein [Oscillospiraceae bacterium]